jgi:hypothetical protein
MKAFDYKKIKPIEVDPGCVRFDLMAYYKYNSELLYKLLSVDDTTFIDISPSDIINAFLEDSRIFVNVLCLASQLRLKDDKYKHGFFYSIYVITRLEQEFLDTYYDVLLPHLNKSDFYGEYKSVWNGWGNRLQSKTLQNIVPDELTKIMNFELDNLEPEHLMKKMFAYRK